MIPPILALDIIADPLVLFLSGLALLILFIWYFVTESDRRKRNIGTILVVGLCTLCSLALFPPSKTLNGGIDLVGGSAFTLKVQPNTDPNTGEVIPLREDDLNQAVATIEKRLGAGGTKDLLIAKSGNDTILLQMPGMSPETASDIRVTLQKVAKLELREVNLEGEKRETSDGKTLAERVFDKEDIVPGYRAYKHEGEDRKGEKYTEFLLLNNRTAVAGADVANAYPVQQGADNIVSIELTGEGGKKMVNLTKDMRPGQDRIAILLDNEVVSAPTVQSVPLGARFVIEGQKNLKEASELAAQLNNPLKNALKIDQESSVSPSLGRAVVKQGVTAALTGLALTAIFILIYYRTAGIVALIALFVNSILIFGAMAMFGFTFTLPGIAGIILTIGMAVDANVLIFERLREELENGKSLGNAIETAYEKAFSAIFDSNITSLLAATILFWKASGTVQGFAVTLTIGLLGSMFSAILVTRVIFRWVVDLGLLRNLSLLNLFRKSSFDFLGKRRIAFVVSALLFIAAISGFVIRGEKGLGVDFTGGTLLKFQFMEGQTEVTAAEATEALKDANTIAKPVVQEETVPGTGELLTVRCDINDAQLIEDTLRSKLSVMSERVPTAADPNETEWAVQATTEAVSATAGKAFLFNACVAIGMGLVAMLIYISIRFEFSFALGAFAALVHDIVIATGLIVLFGGELSLIHVGAILTIAGYSINDTIIVFDRIRESLLTSRGTVEELMNEAINATLSRTLLTSMTTIATVAILAIFGGSALADFSKMILVGLIVGTYSSIFVAAPIVLWWSQGKGRNLRKEVLDASLAGEIEAAS
ncbi:protein translocase subunit SecD [Haloferula sp.]|uniref:protein translocase subunit SecD n=1 Tax=Haloferula sp. TaxID=2497595 RepID=UPI003C728DD2